MNTIKHKQIIVKADYEIFKLGLAYIDAIIIKEEIYFEDYYEFELLIERYDEMYSLGQFVGIEKGRRMLELFLKIKK